MPDLPKDPQAGTTDPTTPPAEQTDPQGNPPQDPPADPPAETEVEDLEALPAWARKQITRANSEAAARRVKERELEEQLRNAVTPEEHERIVNELRENLATTSRQLLLGDIIKGANLPDDEDTREFLTATDEAGLKAQAERLAKLLKVSAPDPQLPPPLDPQGGREPGRPPAADPNELVKAANARRRPF